MVLFGVIAMQASSGLAASAYRRMAPGAGQGTCPDSAAGSGGRARLVAGHVPVDGLHDHDGRMRVAQARGE
jgi:hypothetical protein